MMVKIIAIILRHDRGISKKSIKVPEIQEKRMTFALTFCLLQPFATRSQNMANVREIASSGSSTSTRPSARSSHTQTAAEIKIVSIPKMNAMYFVLKSPRIG